MSRARHRARGGHVSGGGATHPAGTKAHVYAGAGSPVLEEAHERKRGGGLMGVGAAPKLGAGKRARGGAVKRKEGGSVIAGAVAKKDGGGVERKRGGRVAGRARGGATGSDKRPLSSAANIKKLPEERGGQEGAGHAVE